MTGRHIFFGLATNGIAALILAVAAPASAGLASPAKAGVVLAACPPPLVMYPGRGGPTLPADDDPVLTARARRWVERVALGDIDRREFTDELNEVLGPEALAAKRHLLAGRGLPQRLILLTRTRDTDSISSSYLIQYPDCRTVAYVFTVGSDGKIANLLFAP